MVSKKQKAYLRGLAQKIEHRYLLGKNEPDEGFYESLDKALEAKELIKVGVLSNSLVDMDELAADLENQLSCEVIHKIGHVLVLYRKSAKQTIIPLPKE